MLYLFAEAMSFSSARTSIEKLTKESSKTSIQSILTGLATFTQTEKMKPGCSSRLGRFESLKAAKSLHDT